MTAFTSKHTVSSKRLYEGEVINLRVDEVQSADGQIRIRDVVEHNGGVVIACQPKKDEIVLVKQYRYPTDGDLIELPAGRIEKGEEPLKAALRELTEETGFKASSLKEIAKFYSAPGFCDEILYLFHATDVELVERNLDEDEEIEIIVLPLSNAWQMVLNGEILDAKTIAGLGILRDSAL